MARLPHVYCKFNYIAKVLGDFHYKMGEAPPSPFHGDIKVSVAIGDIFKKKPGSWMYFEPVDYFPNCT